MCFHGRKMIEYSYTEQNIRRSSENESSPRTNVSPLKFLNLLGGQVTPQSWLLGVLEMLAPSQSPTRLLTMVFVAWCFLIGTVLFSLCHELAYLFGAKNYSICIWMECVQVFIVLQSLTSLQTLNLGTNKLTQFPTCLKLCPCLASIDLSSNKVFYDDNNNNDNLYNQWLEYIYSPSISLKSFHLKHSKSQYLNSNKYVYYEIICPNFEFGRDFMINKDLDCAILINLVLLNFFKTSFFLIRCL